MSATSQFPGTARRFQLQAIRRARWLAFQVEGMTCPSCRARVRDALLRAPGVITVQAEPDGRVIVTFDPGATTPGKLADVAGRVDLTRRCRHAIELIAMRTGALSALPG